MKLLLITADFPFGSKGDNNFVKNEIMFYQKHFSKITIIATNKEKSNNQILPSNATVVQSDISRKNVVAFIKAGLMLISRNTIKEIKYARTKLMKKDFKNILTNIFKYYYVYYNLKRILINNIDRDTICLSYWLSSRAFALAKLKERGYINSKLIAKCHGFDCYISRGYLPFRQEIDKQFDQINFVSDFGLNDYLINIASTFKSIHSKNKVSHLGVIIKNNDDIFKNLKVDHELNIVSCSSVIQLKRIDIIIEALSLINDLKINWVHFGDGILLEEISLLAEKKLLHKNNIRFNFIGNISNDLLCRYYANNCIDLFVNMSDTEGIPVSVMEAYNYFIPCIGRNVGGMGEIVLKDLLVTDSNVVKGFVDKLFYYNSLSIIDKSKLRRNVKDLLISKYDIENNTNKLLEEL